MVDTRRGKSKASDFVNGRERPSQRAVLHVTFEVTKAFTGARSRNPPEIVDVECGACLNTGIVQRGERYLVYTYGVGSKGGYPLAISNKILPKPISEATAEVNYLGSTQKVMLGL